MRVLLVDDDEMIRESLSAMLTYLGHEVDSVSGGRAAVAFFEQGHEVDLVILDMNMPGFGGAETLGALLAIRPRQAVLIATGCIDQAVQRLLARHPHVSVISKPFTMEDVQARVRSAPSPPLGVPPSTREDTPLPHASMVEGGRLP